MTYNPSFVNIGLNPSTIGASVAMSGSNAILGADDNNGLYYSSDGGATWSQVISTGVFYSLAISGSNAVGGTSSGDGVYYSSDGGATWQQSSIQSGNFNSVAISGLNAIAGSNSGLYYSSDGGENWNKKITSFYFYSVAISELNAIAAGDNGIYYSSDGGENWTQKIQSDFNSVAISGLNAIASSTSGLYYSSDGGENWQPSDVNPTSISFINVAISGLNAIAGSFNGLYYSNDGGANWFPSNITNDTVNSIYISDSNAIAAVLTIGLYYSSDGGVNWFPTNITSGSFISVFISGLTTLGVSDSLDGVWLYTETPPPPPIVCFKEGSKILTNQGYKPIEDLRKGDLVQTLLNGYKQIAVIGKKDIYHLASQNRIKDQLYKCSKDKYPEVWEDLVITGCHSILVDDFVSEEQKNKAIEINSGRLCVTDNKYRLPACTDEKASVYEKPGNYTIYHLALENDDYYMNYGIYANGLLVETCSKRYLNELANMELIE